jgi:AbrB family looped-hinge helix DNA binding protein
MDAAGRIVVPKPLREELGLRAGQVLKVRARDRRIEIHPVAAPVQLVERGGLLVAEPEEPLPPLTAQQVRATLEGIRRDRDERDRRGSVPRDR